MTSKNIIFDMDGVIFDTENLFLNCWRKIAAEHNLAGIDEVYYRVIGVKAEKTKAVFLETYGKAFPYDEFNQLALDMFHEKIAIEGMPLKSGARELLEFLAKEEYQLALASSTKTATVTQQLGSCDLLKYFHTVIGGDLVKNSKPAPDIFLAACERIGATPAETYIIEDSYNGVRAAHAAGTKVIMVPDIVQPDGEIRELTDYIFPSLQEVKDFFHKK
jgi:HAD superfamily hydrolase (TIGR01509 family)